MDYLSYLNLEFAGNELWRIGFLFLSILVAFLLGRIGRFFLSRAADRLPARPATELVKVSLRALARSLGFPLFVLGLRIGLLSLVLGERFEAAVQVAVSVLFVLSMGYMAYCLVDVLDHWMRRFADQSESKLDDMLFPLVRKSLRVTITIMALVQCATIMSDKPLTSVVAGLGEGGLALALAAQDTLKNVFGSLMIFVDKPFETGDRIVVGAHDGAVEEVGLRSTRIRTLDGHLVTIPNGELAHQSIQNIEKRPYLKRGANITLTYDTPPEKVERAVEILKIG